MESEKEGGREKGVGKGEGIKGAGERVCVRERERKGERGRKRERDKERGREKREREEGKERQGKINILKERDGVKIIIT